MIELWDLVPWQIRVAISVASLVFAGYSLSPSSLALRMAFEIDQRGVCELEYWRTVSSQAYQQKFGNLQVAELELGACTSEINPSVLGQIKAMKSGRTASSHSN